MEFQINVTKFMQALSPVIDVATKNTIKDFDSAFMISISAYKDELVLLSHGGNACLQKSLSNANTDKLSYECDDEGEAVVEAKKLMVTLSSFPPNKDVNISINTSTANEESAGEMEVVCDGTEMQSLPSSKNEINMPVLAKKYDVELQVDREVFVAGMQKVNFAVGFEEFRPKYLCQVFDAVPNGAKFIAGNGARFAINEIDYQQFEKANIKWFNDEHVKTFLLELIVQIGDIINDNCVEKRCLPTCPEEDPCFIYNMKEDDFFEFCKEINDDLIINGIVTHSSSIQLNAMWYEINNNSGNIPYSTELKWILSLSRWLNYGNRKSG